jgi:FkbH-like protein
MTNSSKINPETTEIDNVFLRFYITDFVKKFRNFNNDKFEIAISGLEKFIPKDDKSLSWLLERLKENNFNLEFEGNIENINEIDIACRNVSKNTSFNFKYQIQNLPTLVELSSKTDIPLVGIIITKIISQIINKLKSLYKAIVLDLDDTLWYGTLSEDGTDKIRENLFSERGASFIEFMRFVKNLGSELGLFIALCSRNDQKMVESTIHKLEDNIFPLKNHIDFIIANNNDKSENIRAIAEQLSILTSSIVFIDDNQIIRDEVRNKLRDVFVPEWSNHNELITQLIAGCFFERNELSLNSQNRRKQFKIIQAERIQNTLPKLSVRIINDENHSESIKLYVKTNQFKFSQKDDDFDVNTKSLYFEMIRENGENLGICSAITFSQVPDSFRIHNWAMSCRYFDLGLEEFILLYIQNLSNLNKILIDFQRTDYNHKVSEMLVKYSSAFNIDIDGKSINLNFTNEIFDIFKQNTNLSMV